MDPECRELPYPKRLGVCKPRFQFRDGLRPQAIDTHTRVEFIAFFFDQFAPAQDFQVAAHRRKRNARGLGQFTCPTRPLDQKVDHAPPMRVGKRGECAVQMT